MDDFNYTSLVIGLISLVIFFWNYRRSRKSRPPAIRRIWKILMVLTVIATIYFVARPVLGLDPGDGGSSSDENSATKGLIIFGSIIAGCLIVGGTIGVYLGLRIKREQERRIELDDVDN